MRRKPQDELPPIETDVAVCFAAEAIVVLAIVVAITFDAPKIAALLNGIFG